MNNSVSVLAQGGKAMHAVAASGSGPTPGSTLSSQLSVSEQGQKTSRLMLRYEQRYTDTVIHTVIHGPHTDQASHLANNLQPYNECGRYRDKYK